MHSKVEDVEDLSPEKLGMRSAEKFICVLSRYTNAVDDRVKKTLARLSIIVCESAKTNPLHNTFADEWDKGATFTEPLMDYILNWERISAALMEWKDHCYHGWVKDSLLERMGIKSSKDALDAIHLVKYVPISWSGGDRRRSLQWS